MQPEGSNAVDGDKDKDEKGGKAIKVCNYYFSLQHRVLIFVYFFVLMISD